MKKKISGITLIALVITIIVLLILAGVSIAMLTGENGILKQAEDAKEKTTKEQEKEQIILAYNAALAEKMEKQITIVNVDDIEKELSKLNPDTTVEEQEDVIVIKFNKTGHIYTLEKPEGSESIEIEGPIEGEIGTRYRVTLNGTNVSIDGASKVTENDTYTAILKFVDGYGISNIVIIMGGKNLVKDENFTYENNTITIPNVSGNIEITIETFPETAETKPYLPTNSFTQVEGTTLETGLVIKDNLGNSYVWVEVPKTIFTTAKSNTDYTNIEADMQTYASSYRKSGATDKFYQSSQRINRNTVL